MKKTVSIMLCLLLIFSSVNFAFADFTTTDSNNLTSIRNTLVNTSGGTIYYMISQINAAMRFSNKTIANWLSDIENILASTLYQLDGNTSRSIAWWVKEAVLDLDTLVGTSSGSLLYMINEIDGKLTNIYDKTDAIRQTVLMNKETLDDIAGYQVGILGHQNNIDTIISQMLSNIKFSVWGSGTSGSSFAQNDYNVSGNIITFTATALRLLNNNMLNSFTKVQDGLFKNYQSSQIAISHTTLGNVSFTPSSATNGIYSWLKNIQEPIARIAYVHASDEEIAAREKAEANQTAVVNNFIDSNGSGSAPASSFGNVASMSAGYTSNMGTDASSSGIWNIFNSNNFGWFSQETANQLDTTVSTRKESSDFDTPLLDQHIAEIYKELGVDVND